MDSTVALGQFRSTMIAFVVLCTTAVAGRLWLRLSRRAFGYDDATIVLSHALFLIFCGMALASLATGLGSATASTADQMYASKLFVISSLICLLSMYLAKISLALVLFRIAGAGQGGTRKVLTGSIVLLTVWFAISIIMWGIHCVPFSALWGEPGTCRDATWTAASAALISSMDIVFTFFYALMPVYMLRNVQISTRTNIGVYVLLGANLITCVAALIRLKYVVEINSLTDTSKTILLEAEASLYSTIDIGLTILLSSLATLKPLLKVVLSFLSNGQSTGPGVSEANSRLAYGRNNFATAATKSHGMDESKGIEMFRRGDAIRLDDKVDGDSSSQEAIVYSGSTFERGNSHHSGIKRQIDYTVEYE